MTIDRRTLLKTAAAGASAAALPWSGAARAQGAANTIKIGVLNDQSGLYRDISGPTSVACVRQAIQDLAGRGNLSGAVATLRRGRRLLPLAARACRVQAPFRARQLQRYPVTCSGVDRPAVVRLDRASTWVVVAWLRLSCRCF